MANEMTDQYMQEMNAIYAPQTNMYNAQIAALQAQQMANPRPQDFEYRSPLDQSSWTMPSQLMMGGEQEWKNAALGEQKLDQAGQLQAARGQAQAGTAQVRNQLAMRGGVSRGAYERAGSAGQGALMNANTQVGMEGAKARAAIGTQAQQMGMQNKQGNIQNILSQSQLANTAAQQKYATQMAGWAGKEYATAQRQAAQSADSGK